jgi:hypothetical protein
MLLGQIPNSVARGTHVDGRLPHAVYGDDGTCVVRSRSNTLVSQRCVMGCTARRNVDLRRYRSRDRQSRQAAALRVTRSKASTRRSKDQ